MIIKKIAKQCRDSKHLSSTFHHDELWVSSGAAVYSLGNMPYMTNDQIATMFDFSDKVRKSMYFSERVVADEKVLYNDLADEVLYEEEPLNITVGAIDLMIFRNPDRITFCKSELLEPVSDIDQNILRYSLRRTSIGDVIAVKAGFQLVAIIDSYVPSPELLLKWRDNEMALIAEVENYAVQLAVERAESEKHEKNQLTLEDKYDENGD